MALAIVCGGGCYVLLVWILLFALNLKYTISSMTIFQGRRRRRRGRKRRRGERRERGKRKRGEEEKKEGRGIEKIKCNVCFNCKIL